MIDQSTDEDLGISPSKTLLLAARLVISVATVPRYSESVDLAGSFLEEQELRPECSPAIALNLEARISKK